MIKILLTCSAGMSTSRLAANMNQYIKETNLDYEVKALAAPVAKQSFAKGEKWDVVLLGPQVSYLKDDFINIIGNAVLNIIPAAIYAMVQGKETIELVMSSLENKN